MTNRSMFSTSRGNIILNRFFDPTQSISYPKIKTPIFKIREKIQTNKYVSYMRKSYSEAQLYPSLASQQLMNKGTSMDKQSLESKRYLDEEEAILRKSMLKGNKIKNMNFLTQRDNETIIPNKQPRITSCLYSALKSPYKLIDELKAAVEQVVKFKENGPLIYTIRSEFIINQHKQKKLQILRKQKNNRYDAITNDEIEEMYDKFTPQDFSDIKLIRQIKCFLNAKDSKLNQENAPKEVFFNNIENKVNFKLDIFLVPTILNRLYTYPITKDNKKDYCNKKNHIYESILRFLYTKRIPAQKKKDINSKNKKEFTRIILQTDIEKIYKGKKTSMSLVKVTSPDKDKNKDKNKDKDNDIIVKKIRSRDNRTFSEKKVFTETDTIDQESAKNRTDTLLQEKEDENSPEYAIKMYDIEDYFVHKYNSYDKIRISSEKDRNFILTKYGSYTFRSFFSDNLQLFT